MEYSIPIVAIVLVFGFRALKEIKEYLLKKEQIRADALVRSEALRLKNQYELEKLIQNDQTAKVPQQISEQSDSVYEERTARNKQRY